MLFELKQVREVLFSLFVQVDYTSEQRGQLVAIINKLLSIEDRIIELKNQKYVSKTGLNRHFDNLYVEYTDCFRIYVVTFYER